MAQISKTELAQALKEDEEHGDFDRSNALGVNAFVGSRVKITVTYTDGAKEEATLCITGSTGRRMKVRVES